MPGASAGAVLGGTTGVSPVPVVGGSAEVSVVLGGASVVASVLGGAAGVLVVLGTEVVVLLRSGSGTDRVGWADWFALLSSLLSSKVHESDDRLELVRNRLELVRDRLRLDELRSPLPRCRLATGVASGGNSSVQLHLRGQSCDYEKKRTPYSRTQGKRRIDEH